MASHTQTSVTWAVHLDEPPPTARTQLHNMISNLRHRVQEHGLIDGPLMALRPTAWEILRSRPSAAITSNTASTQSRFRVEWSSVLDE
jgi:hypothetical protein